MLKILPFSTAAEFALKTKSALRPELRSSSAFRAASREIGLLTLSRVQELVVAVDRVVVAERGRLALDLLPFLCALARSSEFYAPF